MKGKEVSRYKGSFGLVTFVRNRNSTNHGPQIENLEIKNASIIFWNSALGLQATGMHPLAVVRAPVKARLLIMLLLHPSMPRSHGKVGFFPPCLGKKFAPGDPQPLLRLELHRPNAP